MAVTKGKVTLRARSTVGDLSKQERLVLKSKCKFKYSFSEKVWSRTTKATNVDRVINTLEQSGVPVELLG